MSFLIVQLLSGAPKECPALTRQKFLCDIATDLHIPPNTHLPQASTHHPSPQIYLFVKVESRNQLFEQHTKASATKKIG
jgi:hypothetical protein